VLSASLVSVTFLALVAVPLRAQEQDPHFTTWKADKPTAALIAKRIGELTGYGDAFPSEYVDQILAHAAVHKLGDRFVLLNPAHELILFIGKKENDPVTEVRAITIAQAQKILNRSGVVKAEPNRLLRGFKEGPELIELWRYLTTSKGTENFLEAGLSDYSEADASAMDRQAAFDAVYGPISRIMDKRLVSCFSFLDSNSWKSVPALAKLAALNEPVRKNLALVDFYEDDGGETAALMGDKVVSALYVMVHARKTEKQICSPTKVIFLPLQ
jgi:hypothetical protein